MTWKGATAKKLALLATAISVHAWLASYSFGVLFGLAQMQASTQPALRKAFWELVCFVTWVPLMPLFAKWRIDDRRVFDSHPVPLLLLNSAVAIALLVYVGSAIQNYRSNRRGRAM